MAAKLNSMRILDRNGVDYTPREFPETIHSADGVAEFFGLDPTTVYKTLVVQPAQGKPNLVLIAGGKTLNLKKLATAIGEKRVRMVPRKEAEELTGLKAGGISALAILHKNFPVYIDRPALELRRFLVSAGKRGLNLELDVEDFIRMTQATVVDVT